MTTPDPTSRHHRQAILPIVGTEGQERLRAAHAWIVGCGALGCAVADQLVRAGIGRLTLIDRDVVELTNLQRQTLFTMADLDRPKAMAARERLTRIDPSIEIKALAGDAQPGLIERLLRDDRPTLLLDGTDNFETRYLLNDIAVREGIPMVYGGVIGTRSMSMAILPQAGPCLRCISDTPPEPGSMETCETAGVLGAAVQVAASMQVSEALRILLGRADGCWLIEQDVWARTHRCIAMQDAKRSDCACCSRRLFEHLHRPTGRDSLTLCGRGAVQITPAAPCVLDLNSLSARLKSLGQTRLSDGMLRIEPAGETSDDHSQTVSLLIFEDGRTIVRGTDRPERARSLYARFVGN